MGIAGRRIDREKRTVTALIRLYCRRRHRAQGGLCAECRALLDYALERLERCRFGEDKPVCAKCPVHCYRPEARDWIRAVMREAGPRLVWRHPLLALLHVIDERK